MSSNWTDQLSQQMEHHEVEAPAGLWESIERGLETEKPTRRAKLVWPWRAVAAAAAVTGVVLGVQLWRNAADDPIAQTEYPHVRVPSQKQDLASTPKAEKVLAEDHGQQVSAVHLHPSDVVVAEVDTAVLLAVVQSDEPQTEPPVYEVQPEQKKDENPSAVSTVPQEKSRVAFPRKHRSAAPVSFQLMAMAGGTVAGEQYDASLPSFDSFYRESSDSVTLESQRRERAAVPARAQQMVQSSPDYSDHDFPVKFGAMVRVPLNRWLALDAGISYARLRSELDFVASDGTRKTDGVQHVNYLGVPLALVADVWSARGWNVYASAGGEVAKSVKTQWRDQEGRAYEGCARPWQWSVSAAVGMQFNLNRHVGLYVQPSLDYYFDNRSAVQTYYTEHPFTPALRMGVRVKL